MSFPTWLLATWWGFFAGAALIIGAATGYFTRLPQRLIAAVMAFGSGVLISALSFDLMNEAFKRGGFGSTAVGFVGGSLVYTAANWYLDQRGAKHPQALRQKNSRLNRKIPAAGWPSPPVPCSMESRSRSPLG